MSNPTKAERLARLLNQLADLGFTYSEAQRLRRIEMTLSRWSTAECNGEIQRDETTDKPYRCHSMSDARFPIPDREAGALKRLEVIMSAHPKLWSYHQGDPRGTALYVGRKSDLPNMDKAEIARLHGENAAKSPERRLAAVVRSYYYRGIGVSV